MFKTVRLSISLFLFALPAFALCAEKGPPIKAEYTAGKIAENVYVIHGPRGFPTKENQGFINNPGIVITSTGVVVIDPGSSVQIGEMVLKLIAGITEKPVVALFNTHIHGDHWLGNQAINAAYPKAAIYGHPKMIERAKGNDGQNSVDMLDKATEGATRGTRPIAPNKAANDGITIKIGGISFRIYHNGKAHTDNDIMIEVVEPRVLFYGDNVLSLRLANFWQGSVKGQIEAITIGLNTKAEHFIPGHGPSGGRKVAETYREFAQILYTSIKKYYEEGMLDFEMKEKVIADLKDFQHWTNFDDSIGPVVSQIYLQVEAEMF